jgi:hypothetical protein
MHRKFTAGLMIVSGILMSASALLAEEAPSTVPVDASAKADGSAAQADPKAQPAPAVMAAPGCCQDQDYCIVKKCCPHAEPKKIEYKRYCCECKDICITCPTLREMLHCATHPREGDTTPIAGSVMYPQKEERCLCNHGATCCEGCTHCKPKTVKVLVKFKDEREYCVTKCDVVCEAVPCCKQACCHDQPAPTPCGTTGIGEPIPAPMK